ncbi:glycerate kinase [Alkalicoccus daliensis]|uniref:Glycerate kinase n=1 Tax=Alkalicoccus daliensis TaxID=745820 RepID=A0A1H0J5B2_9BACI|nr:glycerate kinase [Alkalicoccus daliensis]SDO38792.1 glycerate kinase [Alkalicoccus daliensis]
MNIVISPDKFGDNVTAVQAAEAMKRGVLREVPEASITLTPMADGSLGTSEALLYKEEAEKKYIKVLDPHLRPIEVPYWINKKNVVYIDSESVLGLHFLEKNERNLLATSSYGLGELLAAASKEASHIVLSLGTSASADMGLGMLEALGARFHGENGQLLQQTGTKDLSGLSHADVSGVTLPPMTILCKASLPLTGPQGALSTFGLQAGESDGVIEFLESAVNRAATLFNKGTDKKDQPGAGAAGGLGFAFLSLNYSLHHASSFVAEKLLQKHLNNADCIFTGEGQVDHLEHTSRVVPLIRKLAEKADIPYYVVKTFTNNTTVEAKEETLSFEFPDEVSPEEITYRDTLQKIEDAVAEITLKFHKKPYQ